MFSPRHVFVFDNARSCSNLLGKLFSAHPDLVYSRHPYQLAMTRGPEKIELGVSAETMKGLLQKASTVPPELAQKWGSVTLEDSHGKLRALLEEAEQRVRFFYAMMESTFTAYDLARINEHGSRSTHAIACGKTLPWLVCDRPALHGAETRTRHTSLRTFSRR